MSPETNPEAIAIAIDEKLTELESVVKTVAGIETDREIAEDIVEAIKRSRAILGKAIGKEIANRVAAHDLNNQIGIIGLNGQVLGDANVLGEACTKITGQVAKMIKTLSNEGVRMESALTKAFELPAESSTLMIDDDINIVYAFNNLYERKGLGFTSVQSELEFELGLDARVKADFIILDHQIWDGRHGFDLLEELMERYPKAKIVVHTSDSSIVNNPENLYALLGLPVVSKLDLSGIQEAFTGKAIELPEPSEESPDTRTE